VEQAQLVLRGLVERHLVLVLAALLRKGADALVDPLVTVDLGATRLLLVLLLGGRVVVVVAPVAVMMVMTVMVVLAMVLLVAVMGW
jgi:hypothetical protein